MTVSAGVGGGTLGGVVVGSTFTGGGGAVALPSALPAAALPFTGVPHLMLLIAAAMVLLVAGVLMVGLARRAPDYLDSTAPASS